MACATVFAPFMAACSRLLSSVSVGGLDRYESFLNTCTATLSASSAQRFSAEQLLVIESMINATRNEILAADGPVATQCQLGVAAAGANAESMDRAWLVLGGALVFFMHSGFALLEVGSVSARNVQNILFKNVISPTFAAILFWVCGYTFAFGGINDGGFIGTQDGWFLATANVFEPSGAGMPYNSKEYASWFFQWAFAATASTIVSGAVAERINFTVYMIITFFLTGFIYPVVVHWQWGGGWAGAWGVLDFAGSGVVHMTGGIAALVAVLFVGPRHGRFVTQYRHPPGQNGEWYVQATELPLPPAFRKGWVKVTFGTTWLADPGKEAVTGQIWTKLPDAAKRPEQVESEEAIVAALNNLAASAAAASSPDIRVFSNILPASSPAFQTLGCFILWFGWYGFNCASTLGISGDFGGQAAKVAVITTLGAASGSLTTGVLAYSLDHLLDLSAFSNGLLAGLVGITAPCALIEPWAAVVIGAVAGGVFVGVTRLLEAKQIDDVVLAIPVHFGCGLWGLISVGLFASPLNCEAAFGLSGDTESCGVLYLCANGPSQLFKQLVFALAICVWTAATMAAVLYTARSLNIPMAYDADTQIVGMDQKHDKARVVKKGEESQNSVSPPPNRGTVSLPVTPSSAPQHAATAHQNDEL